MNDYYQKPNCRLYRPYWQVISLPILFILYYAPLYYSGKFRFPLDAFHDIGEAPKGMQATLALSVHLCYIFLNATSMSVIMLTYCANDLAMIVNLSFVASSLAWVPARGVMMVLLYLCRYERSHWWVHPFPKRSALIWALSSNTRKIGIPPS